METAALDLLLIDIYELPLIDINEAFDNHNKLAYSEKYLKPFLTMEEKLDLHWGTRRIFQSASLYLERFELGLAHTRDFLSLLDPSWTDAEELGNFLTWIERKIERLKFLRASSIKEEPWHPLEQPFLIKVNLPSVYRPLFNNKPPPFALRPVPLKLDKFEKEDSLCGLCKLPIVPQNHQKFMFCEHCFFYLSRNYDPEY